MTFNLLSTPNKMPGLAFGLPAGDACPVAKAMADDPQSICGKCYALRGHYQYPIVKRTGSERLEWVRKSIELDGGKEFIAVLTHEIRMKYPFGTGVFRIHDRGDFFSVAYIHAWYEIVKQFPGIHFWVPTREWALEHKREALRKLATLPNITVKPSALTFNGMPCPDATAGLDSASGVCDSIAIAESLGFQVCPSTVKGNPKTCGENECFKCFDKSVTQPVAYLRH